MWVQLLAREKPTRKRSYEERTLTLMRRVS